jgi:hypothetical protein
LFLCRQKEKQMKKITSKKAAIICLMLVVSSLSYGQQSEHAELHVNTRWKECSFQIDPSLSQGEWHKFAREAGLVAYFRPLADAKPLGKWKFEVSLLQWKTEIDDSEGAWNNTFVHPDSTHWLKEGPSLGVPGLTGRIGITDKLDVGLYFTKNVRANYGIYGGQIQYNLINDKAKRWSASARAGFNSIFGPEDLKVNIYGVDLFTSKEIKIYSDWVSISPYAGASVYLSSAREMTNKVHLNNENVFGAQATIGLTAKLSHVRLGIEYSFSNTNTLSFKIGAGF